MQLLLIVSLYLLTVFIASGMLWVLYLCVMCLKRAKDLNLITKPVIRLAEIVLMFGLFWDIICNLIILAPIFIILFLDFPHEWTVTARLQRYVDLEKGFQKTFATWFAVNILNPFSQPLPHIRLS